MRIIESDNVKKQKRQKKRRDQKFKAYWSVIEPKDYVKDMMAKKVK